jgi:hypothetical protein
MRSEDVLGAGGEARGDLMMLGEARGAQRATGAGLMGDARASGGLWRHEDNAAILGGLEQASLRSDVIVGTGMMPGMASMGGGMAMMGVMPVDHGAMLPGAGGQAQESLQTLATVAAAANKRKLRRGPDGKFEPKSNILARAQGRFANPFGISQADLTESMICPLMRFCQDTAAEALKVSKNTLSKACKRLQVPPFALDPKT